MSHVDDGTLHAYLDGELAPAEAQGVEAHVAQCPICRNRLDEERALIARADELLGLAAPPERALPPFRPGDLKPPTRLWWQVRLPLAWAATVTLALGVGTYLGSRSVGRLAPSTAEPRAQRATDALVELAQRQESTAAKQAAPRPMQRARPAPMPPPPASATAQRKQRAADSTMPAFAARDALAGADGERVARALAPAAPAAPAPAGVLAYGPHLATGASLTLDSARALLGTEPLAVPGLPIKGMRQATMIGYSAMVVVEQALDSSTTLAVINGRPSLVTLQEVVVTGVARGADSVAPAARGENEVRVRAQAARDDRPAAALFLEVRGPLSPDSLAALRRRLQPLRP